jgi:hypothetical protein
VIFAIADIHIAALNENSVRSCQLASQGISAGTVTALARPGYSRDSPLPQANHDAERIVDRLAICRPAIRGQASHTRTRDRADARGTLWTNEQEGARLQEFTTIHGHSNLSARDFGSASMGRVQKWDSIASIV